MNSNRLTPMGRRIKAGMVSTGIGSAAELARRAGIPRPTAYRWLTQKMATADATTLFAIADVVHMSARWLLTGTGCATIRMPVTPTQRRIIEIHDKLPTEQRAIMVACAMQLEKTT